MPRLSPPELERILALQASSEFLETRVPDSPLLQLLASINRNALSQIMTEHSYEPGDVLFYEGEDGDALYLIWSGKIAVMKGDLESLTVLGFRGPGDIIGEMALVEGQPRSATNIALESSRLLRIRRDHFQQLVRTNPDIGMGIMAMISARLRDADNVRASAVQGGRQLIKQVTLLQTENEQLIELQRVRQETSDLVVHDLRNPLSIIYGVLNMLEVVLPETVLQDNRELLSLAGSACERMRRLVDSLLDVAKLETGEMVLQLVPTNLGPILVEAVHREKLAADARGIVLQAVVADNLPQVLGDGEQLDRVVTNLLDNALKYTPEHGMIVVSAELASDSMVIKVTDTGPGIPPSERERIFERFAQIAGDRPTRRGFGLGLTFCRLAVEAHGGHIWVEPGPNGIGSCFAFTLPVLLSPQV